MKPDKLREQAEKVLSGAELLYTAQQVEAALDRLAQDIKHRLGAENPLVICPMIGGLVVCGQLITRLDFPLELDYIHATRYRGETTGADLHWLRQPQQNVAGRTLLIVDDILDQGITLLEIMQACRHAGAHSMYTAVLVEKQLSRPPPLQHADFTGLTVPDRYVFGYGMDYRGYLRNCAGIYAVAES